MLIALAAHPYAPMVALIGVSLWSLAGTRQAIQALSLVVIIKFLNPALYQFQGSIALFGWIALGVSASRIFYDNFKVAERQPVVPWLALFSMVVFLASLFVSQDTLVSILKI